MTIDERLEAKTQTVELMAHAQIKADERIETLTALMAEAGNFINQLAHIAQAHERRIDRPEGSPTRSAPPRTRPITWRPCTAAPQGDRRPDRRRAHTARVQT
jgi:hypothetical protein